MTDQVHLTNTRVPEMRLLLGTALPRTLQRLIVFEDFNENLTGVMIHAPALPLPPASSWMEVVPRDRLCDAVLGAAFASQSHGLEHLSVSYMIDARDFFAACQQSGNWQHLETLALTSRLLQDNDSDHVNRYQDINHMLYNAAVTVRQMPELRTLVLWNGKRGNPCAFVYQATTSSASITWRATWDLKLSGRVVGARERPAYDLSVPLRAGKQKIQEEMASHGVPWRRHSLLGPALSRG